jgi:hypothetical protein
LTFYDVDEHLAGSQRQHRNLARQLRRAVRERHDNDGSRVLGLQLFAALFDRQHRREIFLWHRRAADCRQITMTNLAIRDRSLTQLNHGVDFRRKPESKQTNKQTNKHTNFIVIPSSETKTSEWQTYEQNRVFWVVFTCSIGEWNRDRRTLKVRRVCFLFLDLLDYRRRFAVYDFDKIFTNSFTK